MTPLYLFTLLGSVFIPAAYSIFIRNYIPNWTYFTISTSVMAFIFLVWDAIFTAYGVWGFNEAYCADLFILKMPIEEWLFFFIIPFCSLFIHFVFTATVPTVKLGTKVTKGISLVLIGVTLLALVMNFQKAYTSVNAIGLLIVLTLGSLYHLQLLRRFYLSFLIILIPFFVVNGILTGAITTDPVVWYDNTENLGVRLGTIPVEDIGYAFTMLFGNLMIYSRLASSAKS